DCSGFVSHILSETNRAWPGFYTGGRETAKGIYRHFHKLGCPDIKDVAELKPGCIVFYHAKDKTPRSATHVALHVVTVPDMHIVHGASAFTANVGPVAFEAGGSGSAATSPRAALCKSATVRVTATDVHGGQAWVAKDPFFHLQRILNGEIDLDVDAAVGGEDALEKLAAGTDIAAADLKKAHARINPITAGKYNRARELAGEWQAGKLPAPLKKYPTDSAEFAILVAHFQRSFGFSGQHVDGKLGPGTLSHLLE
ncbi:MAG TPA: hypothetical protein VKQ06_02245, partial [Gammaproteobacteria bacterium]|nr:hypothetical protein [Gammaproteobacteria bacterium]